MRAVRFAAQLEFALDPRDRARHPPRARRLRARSRPSACATSSRRSSARGEPSLGLELMRTTGLLGATIPELLEGVGMHQNRFHAHDVWHHTLAAVDATGSVDAAIRRGSCASRRCSHDVAKPRTAAPKEDSPSENTFYRHEHVGAAMAEEICRPPQARQRGARARSSTSSATTCSGTRPSGPTARCAASSAASASSTSTTLFALREGDVRARGRGEEPGRRDRRAQGARRRGDSQGRRRSRSPISPSVAPTSWRCSAASPGRSSATCCARSSSACSTTPSLNERDTLARAHSDGITQHVVSDVVEQHHRPRRSRRRALPPRSGAARAPRSHHRHGDERGGRRASRRRRGGSWSSSARSASG